MKVDLSTIHLVLASGVVFLAKLKRDKKNVIEAKLQSTGDLEQWTKHFVHNIHLLRIVSLVANEPALHRFNDLYLIFKLNLLFNQI